MARWLCGEAHSDVTGSALINRRTRNLLQNIAVCVNSRQLAFESFLEVIIFFVERRNKVNPEYNSGNNVPDSFSAISVMTERDGGDWAYGL